VQVEEAPGEEELRAERADRLVHAIKVVSQEVGEATVTKKQACYLPISADGEPLIGRHPKVSGAYIATGHGCWGILEYSTLLQQVHWSLSIRTCAAPG